MTIKIQLPFFWLICLLLTSCGPSDHSKPTNTIMQSDSKSDAKTIDWQGHRGARGLLPENTIPSFLKALEFPAVTTLELDLVVSKDSLLIVSHEPWMSHHICTKPDGNPVVEEEAMSLNIYQMTYDEIKTYDCGSRGNERFPEQQAMNIHKPTFAEMVRGVEKYCRQNNRKPPMYNVELKSHPDGYDKMFPQPAEFTKLMLKEIKTLGVRDRVNLQSFDFNVLRAIRQQDPSISMAMLIENQEGVHANLDKLGFVPPIYSPYYQLLSEEVIREIHDKGMQVIPWTVNDPAEMQKLIDWGVDGIITDYPNRIPK